MFCFELDAAFDFIGERTQADAWKSIFMSGYENREPE